MIRPYKTIRPVKWKISVPADLAAECEELWMDTVRGRPRYGDKSEVITMLLRKWLEEQSHSLLETSK